MQALALIHSSTILGLDKRENKQSNRYIDQWFSTLPVC